MAMLFTTLRSGSLTGYLISHAYLRTKYRVSSIESIPSRNPPHHRRATAERNPTGVLVAIKVDTLAIRGPIQSCPLSTPLSATCIAPFTTV